jgi:signal transduction histidine kinase
VWLLKLRYHLLFWGLRRSTLFTPNFGLIFASNGAVNFFKKPNPCFARRFTNFKLSMIKKLPMPENEMGRIIHLSDYDLDYSGFKENFKDLAKLAASVAGTEISLVNLIDSYTQWSISGYGLDIDQMARENSVCQYTIAGNGGFEVTDLRADERFKDKFYVANDPLLRYYFGVPLKTSEGFNIGALCVLAREEKALTPEKIELLQIIADEIVNRLKAIKVIGELKNTLVKANEKQKKVAHDIRGPLGGIIGLAQMISEQGKSNQLDEVLEFIDLIQKSGRSLLELADEIMSSDKTAVPKHDEFTLLHFEDKLQALYQPQAKNKNIFFTVNISPKTSTIPFLRNKLLQITGNVISNALKFTPDSGAVTVGLILNTSVTPAQLEISVQDTGVGMGPKTIEAILNGTVESSNGTSGEPGYGFGLALVKHLVDKLHGRMQIKSTPGEGTRFEIVLPQAEN